MSDRSPCRVRPTEDVLHREVGDELLLMSLTTDAYFGLRGVAREAWEQFAAGRTVGQVVTDVAERYGVEAATVNADLEHLLDELVAEGLVEIYEPEDR